MTVTSSAPDRPATSADRWQHIADRLADLERRIRELSTATTAALDTHLARLEALRHDLNHSPWPPVGPTRSTGRPSSTVDDLG